MNEQEENLNGFERDEGYEDAEAEAESFSDEYELQTEFAENANRALTAFMAAYPDVEELPDSVINEIITTDKSPVEAYQGYLLELKDLEIAKLRQQQLNKANTPGTAAGCASANFDAFLSEFNSD